MDSEERFDPAVVNDVETARLALRWALDRIRGLQEDLTRASTERDAAESERRKLSEKATERDKNDREWRVQARHWEREALELELRDQLKGEILSEEGTRWREERAVLERNVAALRADLEHSEAAVERARKETLERERSARAQFEAELRKLDILRQSELDERVRMLEERFRGREAELAARFRELTDREAVLEDRLRQRSESADAELARRRAENDDILARRDKELLAAWELRRQELDRSNEEKLRAELRRLEAQVIRDRESIELERRSLEQTARVQEQELLTRRAAIEAEAKRWTKDLDEARERLSSEKAEAARRIEDSDRRAAARLRETEDRFDRTWRDRELELSQKYQTAVEKMRADYDRHVQEAVTQAQAQLLEKDRQFSKLTQDASLKNEQLLHELRIEAEARVERSRIEFVELERKNRENAEHRIEDELQRRHAEAQSSLAARSEALEHARVAAEAEFEARRKQLNDEALLFQERRSELEQRRRDIILQEEGLSARLSAIEARSRDFQKHVDETVEIRKAELEREEAGKLKQRLEEAERQLAVDRERLERQFAEKVEASAKERLVAQEAEHAARLAALDERASQVERRLQEAAADRKSVAKEREILKKEQETFQHMAAQRQKELADSAATVTKSQAQLQKALTDKEKEISDKFLRREAELSTKFLGELKATGQKVEAEFLERYKDREERLKRETAAAEESSKRANASIEELKAKMESEQQARMEALESERRAWLQEREHDQGLSEADRKRLEAERAEWLANLEKERRDFQTEMDKREALFAEREKTLGANFEERLKSSAETARLLIAELEKQVAGERAAYNELKDRSEEGLDKREKELDSAQKTWDEKRKLAEAKLAQARDLLLAQDSDLQRRHKEVSDALNLKDLVFGIAHQIRNPLGVIKSHTQFCLGRKELGKEEGEALQAILRSTDKLGQRLEELIDFTKPLPQHPKPMAASACVEQVLALVQDQSQKQGIQLEKRLPEGLPNVQVDPDLLIEGLLHVVLNSIEALPKGGRMSIELTRDEASGTQRLRVSDNGQGIMEQNLKEVFSPFFSTKPGAVGLGLPIARRLLTAMGGDISLESAYGKGTAVTLTLPEKAPHG